jgi:hypothetical protein
VRSVSWPVPFVLFMIASLGRCTVLLISLRRNALRPLFPWRFASNRVNEHRRACPRNCDKSWQLGFIRVSPQMTLSFLHLRRVSQNLAHILQFAQAERSFRELSCGQASQRCRLCILQLVDVAHRTPGKVGLAVVNTLAHRAFIACTKPACALRCCMHA